MDGYARATGRLGVLCVTYGAGGLNVVNAVAGSYSERVPILVVSGGPGEEKRKLGILVHHQAKEIESQFRVFKEITCAAKIIDNPQTAVEDIHEVMQAIWLHQQPGYIEIHQDMVERKITVPKSILAWDGTFDRYHSDPQKVAEAARDTVTRLNQAKKPFVIVGIEVFRHKLVDQAVALVEKTGAPCATTVLAKGAFPADHPQHMGVHIGVISPEPIRRRVDEADLVVNLGTLLTDMNLGSQLPRLPREKLVWASENRVDISHHSYTDVTLDDYLQALLDAPIRRRREAVSYHDNLAPQAPGKERPIGVTDMLCEVNAFLNTHPETSGGGRGGRYVVCRPGRALWSPQQLSGPGLLRLNGVWHSGCHGGPARYWPAPVDLVRRRGIPDDRTGNRPRSALRVESDCGADE